MKLKLENFTEAYAKEVCDWKYDGEYAVYNYPSWDKVSNDKWAIAVEEKRKVQFSALVDEDYNLCAYIRVQDKIGYLLIGVGIKPSLCGHRLGNILMYITKQYCNSLCPNKTIALEVRSFNKRAIKCYKKAGFVVKEVYRKDTPIGYGEFIMMEFSLQS